MRGGVDQVGKVGTNAERPQWREIEKRLDGVRRGVKKPWEKAPHAARTEKRNNSDAMWGSSKKPTYRA